MTENNKKCITKKEAEEMFQKYIDNFYTSKESSLDYLLSQDKNKGELAKYL